MVAETPAGSAIIWDAATWHATGLNLSERPRHTILAFYHRRWVRGIIDNEHVIPPHVRARLVPEMRHLLGLEVVPPDYSEVRRLTPEQLAQLTPEEKEVIGIGIY